MGTTVPSPSDKAPGAAGRRWRDALYGAGAGLAVVLVWGEALAEGVQAAWRGAVLPAFLELGLSGLPFCG